MKFDGAALKKLEGLCVGILKFFPKNNQHFHFQSLLQYVQIICISFSSTSTRGCGTVVARPLCMRQVRGSIPRFSKQHSIGHVFDSRWVLVLSTHSSVVEQWIAAKFLEYYIWLRRGMRLRGGEGKPFMRVNEKGFQGELTVS